MVINVKTSMSSYDIVIENNAINNINKYLNLSNKVLIVTDDGIPEIYITTIKNQIFYIPSITFFKKIIYTSYILRCCEKSTFSNIS